MSTDPVGEGWNHYGYCLGNPILFFDPTGLAHEISAAEWEYRAQYGLWDPSGNSDFDIYIANSEVSLWSSTNWNLDEYAVPNDILFSHSIMQEANNWQGVPYLWGGNSTSGIDCSHLTNQVYTNAGYSYPYSSTGLIPSNTGLTSTTNPRQGDLILLEGHIGIYNPNNPSNKSIYSATSNGVRWGDPSWWNGTPTYYRPK